MGTRGLLCLSLAALAQWTSALDNGIALKPPMGWRSWNCYAGDVDDPLIRSIISRVTERTRTVDGIPTSIRDLGYIRVGIDDGWQACETGRRIPSERVNNGTSFHADDGAPLVNLTKFPSLIDLVAYGHAAGVLMGWYQVNCICMDTYTLRADAVWAEKCYLGDVIQVLGAGFDGLKIDNCGDDDGSGFVSRVKHLNESGRAILIENSNQGHGDGPPRGKPNSTVAPGWCNFHMFRTDGDIGPYFDNVISKLQYTIPYLGDEPISRPGCWAYPDMLELGNFVGPLNLTESRTHFGAWCVVSSPLILSFDLNDAAKVDSLWDIISNKEAIAINQEWAGHPGRRITPSVLNSNSNIQIWAKRLAAGAQAVLVFNTGTALLNVTIDLADLGLQGCAAAALHCSARDVWAHRDVPSSFSSTWTVTNLGAHDSVFYKFTISDAQSK